MAQDQAMAAGRGGRRTRAAVLLPWHLLLLATFVVAFLSGTDASFVQLHLYAGCAVVGLLALRLGLGLASPALALRRPSLAAWRGRGLLAWLTTLLLLAVPAAAASGWGAGATPAGADLHAELSNLAMGVVTIHAAVAIAIVAG